MHLPYWYGERSHFQQNKAGCDRRQCVSCLVVSFSHCVIYPELYCFIMRSGLLDVRRHLHRNSTSNRTKYYGTDPFDLTVRFLCCRLLKGRLLLLLLLLSTGKHFSTVAYHRNLLVRAWQVLTTGSNIVLRKF